MIKSHKNPDKPLWQSGNDNGHMKDVYDGMKNILTGMGLSEDFLSDREIDLYSKIIGYCHDIGKATTFFQEKLETETQKYGRLSNHSQLGAVFSYYISDTLNLSVEIKLLIYRLLYCHHSSEHKNSNDLDIGDNNDGQKNVMLQINNILDNPDSCEVLNNVLNVFNINSFDKERFFLNIKTINKKNGLLEITSSSLDKKEKNIILYFILYSAFSKADKYDALFREAFKDDFENRNKLSNTTINELVDNYKKILKANDKEKFKDSKLNNLRDEFYNDIQTSIDNLDLEKDKILQVVAPTGIGKTLTIFNAAVKLKNRLLKEQNKIYRIIYSLPFISIIDQTATVLKNVFETNNIKITGDLFLEYHHLSDTTKRDSKDEDTNYRIEENIMLNDFWESEIILTTFVSFLEVFSSGSDLLKLSSIANSIIILDEVQSIDAGLYKYINWFFKILAKYLNCYVILTTATMPKIFQEGEYKNLYHNEDLENKLYANSNRYLIKNLGDKSIEGFIVYLKDYIKKNKNESVLVVANTKKMAFQISKALQGEYDNNLIHLTTATIPLLRKKYIKSINNKENKKRKIIISTQLIEAGVDISVNTIFKFLSPYESIIQAAGRANRNYELNELGGKIFIVNILNEKNKPSYEVVYVRDTKKTGGDIKMNVTKGIFEEKELNECELLPISKQYFDKLILNNWWNEIKKDLISEQYCEFGDKINIINDEIDKYSVFIDVEIQGEDGKIIKSIDTYNKYINIKNQVINSKDDLFNQRNQLKQLKSEFSQFCINITDYETKSLPEISNIKNNYSIILLNKESYDFKLGLKIFDKEPSCLNY